MKIAMKKVINICALLSFVLVLMMQTEIRAAEVTEALLQIDNYTINEGALIPGGTVTLNLSIKNISKRIDATNVVLSIKSESGYVYPIYGDDNQIIFDRIEAGKAVDTSIQLNVSKHFKDEVLPMSFDFTYLDSGRIVNNEVMLAIPSITGYPLLMSEVKVAERATVGEKSLINFKLTNICANEIKDAIIEVSGNVEEESKMINLGKISANKQLLKDYYVTFDTPGMQTFELTLKYTDSNGEKFSINQGSYSVNVEPVNEDVNVIKEGSTLLGKIGYVIAGISGILIILILIWYAKKHI